MLNSYEKDKSLLNETLSEYKNTFSKQDQSINIEKLILLKKNALNLKSNINNIFKNDFLKIKEENIWFKKYLKEISILQTNILVRKDSKKFILKNTIYHDNKKFSLHPLQSAIYLLHSIFKDVLFNRLDSNLVVDEYENFDALLINKSHPSRDSVDTFKISENYLLRSHTTTCQSLFIKNNIDKHTPIKIFSIGRVFRRDYDKTHLPSFQQVDAFHIDKNISVLTMINFIKYLLSRFFERNIEIRIRNSFFPFTNPSFEIDIFFDNKWFEVLGCGLMHEKIIRNMNLDPAIYQGYALGMGIERLVMIKIHEEDIKKLHNSSSKDI